MYSIIQSLQHMCPPLPSSPDSWSCCNTCDLHQAPRPSWSSRRAMAESMTFDCTNFRQHRDYTDILQPCKPNMYYSLTKKACCICRRWYCVLMSNFHFVVGYLICFYMWLRVLTSRKVAIYSDGDNIIIIIIGVFRFKV